MKDYLFTLFSLLSVAFSPNGYPIDELGIRSDLERGGHE
jgi:hypothetical protein